MPIEIKTLTHLFVDRKEIERADKELSDMLNGGWEILAINHLISREEELVGGPDTVMSRVVTLMREAPAASYTKPAFKALDVEYVWRDKQRVQLRQDLPDAGLPLNAGDLGYVTILHTGEQGVLFDRYEKIVYSALFNATLGIRRPILDFCKPANCDNCDKSLPSIPYADESISGRYCSDFCLETALAKKES
jgi:hypothetical protein